MALKSSIEWTESSWNPVTGCTKISAGCKNCYAEKMAKRLQAMGQKNYINGFNLTIHEEVFNLPLKWKTPQMIFVNSMSDLFHESLPFEIIKKLFDIMNKCYWHTFQILTKRSNILYEYSKYLNWSDNIWMGVTVENQESVYRIYDLQRTDAKIKFISFEPLISDINDVDLRYIDWVIVGGESGAGFRVIKEEWVLNIKEKCEDKGIPFFFKQCGGYNKKKNGRLLLNREWKEIPSISKNKVLVER